MTPAEDRPAEPEVVNLDELLTGEVAVVYPADADGPRYVAEAAAPELKPSW